MRSASQHDSSSSLEQLGYKGLDITSRENLLYTDVFILYLIKRNLKKELCFLCLIQSPLFVPAMWYKVSFWSLWKPNVSLKPREATLKWQGSSSVQERSVELWPSSVPLKGRQGWRDGFFCVCQTAHLLCWFHLVCELRIICYRIKRGCFFTSERHWRHYVTLLLFRELFQRDMALFGKLFFKIEVTNIVGKGNL